MAQTISKFATHSCLFISSLWCLSCVSRNLWYARACFKLFALMSGVSLFDMIYPSDSSKRLEIVVWVWSFTLGLPLLATDLAILSPNVPDISPLHLVIPLYTVLTFHANPAKADTVLLLISHSITLLFMAGSTICESNVAGFLLTLVHLLAELRWDTKPDTPWAILMTLSNVLSLNLIAKMR